MSTSEISSELSPMAQCGDDHSDIGGFLSASCMETDVEKSDPFNSDNTLGFPEDSSRFDSECILSSSLVEGVSMPQTTACDSLPSFVTGLDNGGSCSVLSGGSLLLYDIPSSSVQKPVFNPVMQMVPSNLLELLGATEVKGDDKLGLLPPVQLLTTSAAPVSQTQSHPIVIGNPGAASFVKSVLSATAQPPTTTTDAPQATRDAVTAPPVMFLNPAFLPLLQSVSGVSSSPMLIQLPPGLGITAPQETEQLVTSDMSQPGSSLVTSPLTVVTAPVASVSGVGVSVGSLSTQCNTVMMSADSHEPSTSAVSCVATPGPSVSASLSVHTTTARQPPQLVSEPTMLVKNENDCDSVPASSAAAILCEPSFSHSACEPSLSSSSYSQCETSASLKWESQAPRLAQPPIVISCVRPQDRGMKQILEHFLQQQTKASVLQQPASSSSLPVPVPPQHTSLSNHSSLLDSIINTSASASEASLLVSSSDSELTSTNTNSAPALSVPSLGRKSSSVVFILRRTDSPQACSVQHSMDKALALRPGPGKDDVTTGSANCSVVKDEVDGAMRSAVNSTLTAEAGAPGDSIVSTEDSDSYCLDKASAGEMCASVSGVPDVSLSSVNVTTTSSHSHNNCAIQNDTLVYNSAAVTSSDITGYSQSTDITSDSVTNTTNNISDLANTSYSESSYSDGGANTSDTTGTSLDLQLHGSASTSDTDGHNAPQYQWVQIQVPASLSSETTAAAAAGGGEGEGGGALDDIQRLIPLTVNEAFSADLGRPIIICIVQQDGLTRRVNINPLDMSSVHLSPTGDANPNPSDSTSSQHTQGLAVESGDVRPQSEQDTKLPSSEVLDSAGDQSQPGLNPLPQPCSSTPVTPSPSYTSAESSSSPSSSSSPQNGSDGASPPGRVETKRKTAEDKQYKCDLCTAVFTRLGNYTRHRKIHTLNLKEDNHFRCPHCDRPFLQRCDMNRHMAVHTNQYPFRCQTCDKGYIRKSDLVVHERFHSKTRAFKCDTCGRAFYQSGDLRRHKRFVHMEQSQLSCGHCHRKYASEVTLIRHIKTAHNDILLQSVVQQPQQQQ